MRSTLLSLSLVALTYEAYSQNTCATALNVGLGVHAVDAVNGTEPLPVSCATNGNPGTLAEWYTYTATVDTTIRLNTDVAGTIWVDTRVHIYTGTCGSLNCLAGDDDSGSNLTSLVTFPVTAGQTYTIGFDNRWTTAGFSFELAYVQPAPPPPPPPPSIISFTNVTQGVSGSGYCVVDMNNDQLDDIVGTSTSNVNILYQQANGTFQSVNIITTPADHTASWSIAAGDIDGNGYNDLLYGGGSGSTFMMANNTGTGFTEVSFPNYIFSQRTNMVDINNDGHLDAFVCHDVDANVAFFNDGNGNLTFNQGLLGLTCGNYGSIWTDYDNDGDIDMFVAKCGCDPVDLLMRNNGDGTFTNVAPELGMADSHQSWSSAWGDFDNDGDMDVLIGASSSGYHKLLENNGDGTFTNITAGSGIDLFTGQSIEWTTHDFDNNGYLDILGGGGLLMNMGDMTFVPNGTFPGNGPIGDLNNDGFLDVYTSGTIRRNVGNDNNWLKIATVGVVSNSNGIGARITVETPSGTFTREVRSGDGFRYMSTMTAHFGLGEETEITAVTVRWPSGIVDVIEGVDVNTTEVIVEGVSTGLAAQRDEQVQLFPVPAQDILTVSGLGSGQVPVRVLDATGRLVLRGNLLNERLDVSGLTPGAYVLQVFTPNGTTQRSFTKE
ncbi:MAG: FG-GAP-like repeat-containing protein [Flavobacteriales bacterium]